MKGVERVKMWQYAVCLLASCLLSACATLDRGQAVALDRQARWVVLPVINQSDTPQAGQRVESLLENRLRAAGVQNLLAYPITPSEEALLDPRERKLREEAEQWAREQGARYALIGYVNEWRYKVGVDGEPAVGLVLQIIDLQEDKVIYSASGARTGWSREALSAVGQKLIRDLLAPAGL